MHLDLPEGLQGMVFDLDGVIVDSEPVHMDLLNRLCEPYGPPMRWDEYVQLIGGTDRDAARYLTARYQLPFSQEELIERYHEALIKFAQEGTLPVIPGVSRLMCELSEKDIALAVASSSSRINIEKSLCAAGVKNLICAIVSGQDVKRPKPAPDAYLQAVDALGLCACACAAIEDTAVGIAAAKAAGLYAIGYLNSHSGNQDLSKADRVIRSFDELIVGDLPEKLRVH